MLRVSSEIFPIHEGISTPTAPNESQQQQAPRIVGTIRKLFATLRKVPNQEASLKNLSEFIASNEKEISEKRSSVNSAFSALLAECERTMIEIGVEPGCEVYRMVANMTLSDGYARRHRTIVSLWTCVKKEEIGYQLKGDIGRKHSDMLIQLLMYLISSSPIPLTSPNTSSVAALDIIAVDCVTYLRDSQTELPRRLLACNLLIKLIAKEQSSVRSLNHVRELSVVALWDVTLKSLTVGLMPLALRTANLCACMTANILDSTSSTAQEELEELILNSLRPITNATDQTDEGNTSQTDSYRVALCALLLMSEILNQQTWSQNQAFIDTCQASILAMDWKGRGDSSLHTSFSTYVSSQKEGSMRPNYCFFVAASALLKLSDTFSVMVNQIFEKLLSALVCLPSVEEGSVPFLPVEERNAAADALANTVSHWGESQKIERVFSSLLPLFQKPDEIHEQNDASILMLIEVMASHNAQCLSNILRLLSAVGGDSDTVRCADQSRRVTFLTLTRQLLAIAKSISEGSLQQAVIQCSSLITFDPKAPKEVLTESLQIMAICSYTQRLDHALLLFKHEEISVRKAAVSAIISIISTHIKATATSSNSVRIDNTVGLMVERVLDVAVVDMDAGLRFHTLSHLDRTFDTYLSMPDNIATIFIAYHDIDLPCSEASIVILSRLLAVHPAHIVQGLTRLQEELLKEIEERNLVGVTLAATRKLNRMLERGTILVSCKQIEKVLLGKLNPQGPAGPFTHPLVVELLTLLQNSIESPSPQHESLGLVCKLATYYAREGQSCQIRVAALAVLRSAMRTKAGVIRSEQSQTDVYEVLEEVINDGVNQMDEARKEAMGAFGAFGAVNPVTMRRLRKIAADESKAAVVITDTTGLVKPLARTHPRLEETYPSVALYLLVKSMQGADIEKQETTYKCILDMLRETSVAHKQQLISSFLPLLRRTLMEPESAPLHGCVLEIMIDLAPLLKSTEGVIEGSKLMQCLGKYCGTPDAALAPLSSLVVTLLDELAKALPAQEMLSHRWAIDFILARLNNDMDDPDLVLRVIQSLESFACFMKDKDLRHVVPQVLQCLCSPPLEKALVSPAVLYQAPVSNISNLQTLASRHDPNSTLVAFSQRAPSPSARSQVSNNGANAVLVGMGRMINGSCLEFVNQIVLKHHVLARDLCALIVHRILEFVSTKTDATVCDLAMSTLVSLLTAVDKAGRRFMDPIVRTGSKNPAVAKSEHFSTITKALAGQVPLSDQKVKLPAVVERSESGQGELLFKIVCDVPQVSKGAFVQEMWGMRIGPQHVLVINISHRDNLSIIDFRFAPNPEADRNAREFLKATRNEQSSLNRNLRIVDVQFQRQGIGAANTSFIRFTAPLVSRRSKKAEGRWLDWLHKMCTGLLECSPHSSLRALVPIAEIDREVAVSAFPFAVTSVLSNLPTSDRAQFMNNLNLSLASCPFDVKRVIFELAEFMEGERLTRYIAPRDIRYTVRRPSPEAKFGINYDQDKYIVVNRLAPGGPGELAGVPVGAILVSINGEVVRNVSDIPQMIKGKCEIDLVLTPPVDTRPHPDDHYLDVPKMALVSNECQLHAKAIYFNEQVFDTIVSMMEKNMLSGVVVGDSERHQIQLQLCVESLIKTYQHLGFTMEAKGIVSFISDKVTARVIPERFNFDQAATLEQLNWWQDARRLYEMRMDTDSSSLLGAVRCWDALGDLRNIVDVVSTRGDTIPPDTFESLQRYRGNAAMILGEWSTLDEIGSNKAYFSGLDVVPKVAVLLRQNKATDAAIEIKKAREDLFDRLVDGFSEGYVRAYDLLVEAQHLNHLMEVIDYSNAAEEKRAVLRSVWSTRLLQMAPKPQHWRVSIAISSLVLTPEEDISPRIETALLCSRSQQQSLSEHILLQLLKSSDINSSSNWGEQNPQILVAYAQHRFTTAQTEESRRSVYDNLANVLNLTAMPPPGTSAAEGWGNCWLQLGEWSPQFTSNHEITLQQLRTAAQLNANNANTFHYLGRAHQSLSLTAPKNDARKHVAKAIGALFRAVQLSGTKKTNLQSILRILSMWFQYGDDAEVNSEMSKGVSATDISVWLAVVPQLLARMGITSRVIRDLLSDLLTRVGESFPQALIYPLTVSKKKMVAEKALEGIQQVNADLVHMASQISNELVRIAILWNEKWSRMIQKAAKTPTDCNEIMAKLQSLYAELDHPATPNEQQFVQTHRQNLSAAWSALQRKEDGPAWHYLKKVYSHTSKANDRRLYLRDVSPILAEMNSSVVAVPGTFHPSKPVISIASFQPKVIVMASKQKPRRFGLIGSDGLVYRFLLKGHEDLRQDQRVMQFIELVNSFFQNDATSIEHGYAIPSYAVIPLTENVGILGWVENTETIFKMLEQRRNDHSIDIYLEINMIIKQGGLTTIDQYSTLPKQKRADLLRHISRNCPNNELALITWERNESCEGWLDYRKLYSQTFALMSMVGYVLGLGDRHLNNLMLQHGGNLVHIDFGDCFEVAMQRQSFAEAVPFRLTRLMVRALGVTGVDGAYRITCENVMKLLRRNRENLITILETFLYDPLINWCGEVEEELTRDKASQQVSSEESGMLLACSLSTRKALLSNALLTDEWAVLSDYIRQGGDKARRAAPLPPGYECLTLADAIERVRAAVNVRDFPLANGWMSRIQQLAPDVCVQSVFEQSIHEKRSLAANKALARVQAKLNGTDFSLDSLCPTSTPSPASPPVRGSAILDHIIEKGGFRNTSPGDFDSTPWSGANGPQDQASSIAKGLPVRQQVDKLIEEATSFDNLAEAFITGWAPFW